MLTGLHRIAHWCDRRSIPLLPRIIYVFNRIVFSVALPPGVQLGRRVLLGYSGLGIVIHRGAVIEDDVIVGPGVVVGGRSGHVQVPYIRRGAVLGAGAKILGPVVVGRYAQIGANAVVLDDVPDGGVAVGVPARVIRIDPPPIESALTSGPSRD